MQLKEVMKGDVTSENMVLWKKKKKIELFKQVLPFLRKIQVSLRRVIYIVFQRVLDLVVLVKELE